MQCSDNPSTILLQPAELGHRIFGFGNTDLDTSSSQSRECFFRDLHATIVAGSDDEHLRSVGQDGLEVLQYQSMPFTTPPALLHMIGKDDHVGVVVAAGDTDLTEAVVVDFHVSQLLVECFL